MVATNHIQIFPPLLEPNANQMERESPITHTQNPSSERMQLHAQNI